MQDIFSGPGRSDEMDTLLFRTLDDPDCTLRLCALQQLEVGIMMKDFTGFFLKKKNPYFMSLTPPLLLEGVSGHQSGTPLHSHLQQVAQD